MTTGINRCFNRSARRAVRCAFTLVELLVVIAIVSMLVALLLPAVQSAREAARKTQCVNNMRQLGLAFQNHHEAIGYFPESQIGSGEPDGHGGCRGGMYSWHARVLPFLEENALYDSIDFNQNMADSCTAGQDGTISQLHTNAPASATEVPVFLCPSDGVTGSNAVVMGSSNPASDNYAANAGWPTASSGILGTQETPMKYNGLVTLVNPARPDLETLATMPVRIRNISDGLSKTAAIAERLIQTAIDREAIMDGDARLQSFHLTTASRTLGEMVGRCTSSVTHADAQHSAYLGRAWISGWSPTGATYRHLRTPNTTNCHFGDSFTTGESVITPSSDHVGGVNVAMADGHVKFVTDDVEPSLWWGMGNRQDGNGN
jgi:prepilin-type N-terminal cleavage/methylation domain-containing protein/prepilin-type processing-associated H-X9-DG protein